MVTTVFTPEELFDLLSEIPDPEIPVITIKDLGILREVKMEGEQCVVTITPTYTACPAMGWIEDQIRQLLLVAGIADVKVITSYAPAWTTDWMTEQAKEKLRHYGIAPPAHSSCTKLFEAEAKVICPHCNSMNTELISRFGSTACKALYKCNSCREVFDMFKCH